MYKKIILYSFLCFCAFPVFAAIEEKSDYGELLLHPEDTHILRKAAQTALKKQDLTRAVVFLEQLTVLFPEEKNLWQDLSDVYLRLGNKQAAQHAVSMRNKSLKNFTIKSLLGAGTFYDDNIFFRNGKDSIRLGRGTLHLLKEKKELQKRETSWGGYAQAGVSMNMRLYNQLSFIADANVFAKRYKKADIQNLSINAASGLYYDTSRYTVTALGMLEHFREDSNSELIKYGFQPSVSFKFSDIHLTTKGTIWHLKYLENKDMDANFFRFGQDLTFLNSKGSFTFGGRYFSNRGQELIRKMGYLGAKPLKGKLYDYDGWQALVGFRYNFFDNFQCLLDMSYENRRYKKPALVILGYFYEPIFDEKRHDIKTVLSLKLRYFFTKTIGLEGTYDGIHNESNTNTYDYVQNVFGLGMLFQF